MGLITHGGFNRSRKTYQSWSDMKQRCLNPACVAYRNYGARGISICRLWLKFENFLLDMGEKPEGLSLERKDVNGNYEPDNCKWATKLEQNGNRRDCRFFEHDGKRLNIDQWSREAGVHPATIRGRLRNGLPFEQAISKRKFRWGYYKSSAIANEGKG